LKKYHLPTLLSTHHILIAGVSKMQNCHPQERSKNWKMWGKVKKVKYAFEVTLKTQEIAISDLR
jgi:hypothetical protein